MRQMVLRFFLYIWGAILGTTFLVMGLVIGSGQPPPGHVPVEAVQSLMQGAARDAFTRGGIVEVRRLLAQDAALAAQFSLTETAGADCAGPDVVGGTGKACLRLRMEPSQISAIARLLPFLTPIAIGCVLSVLGALLLARRFVRPIQRIGEGLMALSRGDLGRRIGPALDRSEPAIADVGRAFDVAADKLQDLTESRSRLFHDISHEIRSPLARLQAETALLRQNPARLPAMLPRMDGDIARMDQLVEEILTLARLERGEATMLKPMPIDLIDLLDPILRDAEFEGQPRGIRICYTGPEQFKMRCDPELLHRAFENILRNALRYAPEDSTVEVTVEADADVATVKISDSGPGVDKTLLPAIFKAFVRDEDGHGIGLGLAIAAKAIRLHGGTIHAENQPGGGFAVACTLPSGGHFGKPGRLNAPQADQT